MTKKQYPAGWSEARIRAVANHYETQSEDKAELEDEAAFSKPGQTVMVVPRKLVPEITRLIEKRRSGRRTQ
jgi:hypothetical protein